MSGELRRSMEYLVPMPLTFAPGAIIFDCDGTLAHTMPLHYKAWRSTLDAAGHPALFPETQFYDWGGTPAREILLRLNELHQTGLDADALTHTKEMAYREFIPDAQPIRQVIAEVERFFGVCPLAVASGGMRALVEQTLITLGIRDRFDVVVGSEDVAHGKPAPDIFLLAAEKLGVAPDQCVVYEDAPNGLEAARRAGMRAVDVRRFADEYAGMAQ